MSHQPYLRLKRDFVLRGWEGLPYALVYKQTGAVHFMREEHFRTISFCNGRFTEDSPVFLGVRREHLRMFDEHGVLERLDEPGELEEDQKYRLYPNRFIKQVHWSITGHCNYRCKHCYMSAPHALLPQPSFEECLRVIEQMTECGIPYVSLTGGEPLVHPDFLKIVDAILEHGMRITLIMSNGALVNEQLLNALEERGVTCEFNMSYDGTEGWHDWLRGVHGAESSVRRAFELCREHGFVTGAEFVLHKGNQHTLRDSIRVLGELGVSSLKVSRLNCVGEGASLSDYELSPAEEFETYLEYLPHYVEDGMPVPILVLSGVFYARFGKFHSDFVHYEEGADCGRKYLCNAARNMMYLGPDGRVLPCIPMSETDASQESFPTIQEMTLTEALLDSTYMSFVRTNLDAYLALNPECAACTYRNRCAGGCRGRATISSNGSDLLGIDPDSCLFFRGGYYDRTMELIHALQSQAS